MDSGDDLHLSGGSGGEAGDPLRYATTYHAPVLWHTVVRDLITKPDGVYVDATLGGGGHTAALLDVLDAGAVVVGIDRDADALAQVRTRHEEAIAAARLRLVRGDFGDLAVHLDSLGIDFVDGILLDLGVSSHQIDEAERGFSYMSEGPLDMRMNRTAGVSAHDIVNEWAGPEIARVLFEFGEEPASRRIARAIVDSRPIETTRELASVVRSVVPSRVEVKTLSRTFQGLRIAVNNELTEIERALQTAEAKTRLGGRAVVISYHSLEDRRVKRFFRTGNFEGQLRRDMYGNPLVAWRELHRKPVEASADEMEHNPRARSARLRSAERVKVPAQ